MFDRLIKLIGEENFEKIKKTKVLVLGLGGVGGYVVETLARSGIQNIGIVDKDIVELSNINRQIIAVHSTIGKNKTDVWKERLLDINPDININVITKEIKSEDIEDIVKGYDYIVDAVDDVNLKVDLINYCTLNKKNLITSCGTALKLKPKLLEITTLDKTSYDPLAKVLRKKIDNKLLPKVKVLSSTEKPVIAGSKELASAMFVPASGGILIASYVINEIIKKTD